RRRPAGTAASGTAAAQLEAARAGGSGSATRPPRRQPTRSAPARSCAREEKATKRAIRRRIGRHERVLDSLAAGARPPAFEKRGDVVAIRAPRGSGVERGTAAGLEVDEFDVACVRKIDLLRADDVQHRD